MLGGLREQSDEGLPHKYAVGSPRGRIDPVAERRDLADQAQENGEQFAMLEPVDWN